MTITILLSLIIGISFIIGSLISKIIGYKKLTYFSISLIFITLLSSLILNIISNIFKLSTRYHHLLVFIITIILSIVSFILVNNIIPNNNCKYATNKKDDNKYLYHIGIIGFITVIIFNILCGIILYILSTNQINSGVKYATKMCLFNIPFGIALSSLLNIKKNYKYYIIVISNLIGVIIGYIIPHISQNVFLLLLSFTCGIILTTSLLLYGVEIIKNRKKNGIIEGILIGLIIFAYILL